MAGQGIQVRTSAARRSIFLLFFSFATLCFIGTLATDVAYWRSADWFWVDCSDWLVTTGVCFGAMAFVIGLIELIALRAPAPSWRVIVAGLLALILGGLDMLVHTRDAWTSVVPLGLALSAIVVVLLLTCGWIARRGSPRIQDGDIAPRRSTRTAGGVAVLAVAALGLALWSTRARSFDEMSQVGPNPILPAPQQYLFPPMHLAKVVGWKEGETPTVAQGLKISALATGLEHPRSLYVLPNGDVLIAESKSPNVQPIRRPKDIVMGWIESWVTSGGHTGSSNRITLVREGKGGGNPEVQSVFLDHLSSPFGVALVGSDLYVADTDYIVRYTYRDGDTIITQAGTPLTPLPGGPIDHHWTKSLVASRDGTLLYVGVGSNSNVTENGMEAEENRAAIWEVDRASGRWRIFASGLRNPNGLSFEPESGALWAVINERDELGPNLVPDYLTSVKDGGFYGWPYSYFGQHVDPRVQPQRPDLVAKAIVPDYALSSHVAPLGLVFNTGGGLPAKYNGGAFVGEHGSWDRPEFNGYKIVFVPFSGGRPAGKAEDVVTGFLNADGQARGRPVGVAIDKSGALLIADDVGNTVWRVTAADR